MMRECPTIQTDTDLTNAVTMQSLTTTPLHQGVLDRARGAMGTHHTRWKRELGVNRTHTRLGGACAWERIMADVVREHD